MKYYLDIHVVQGLTAALSAAFSLGVLRNTEQKTEDITLAFNLSTYRETIRITVVSPVGRLLWLESGWKHELRRSTGLCIRVYWNRSARYHHHQRDPSSGNDN